MTFAISFRPRLAPTLAAVAGIVLTAALGDWQLRRAAYKEDLQAQLAQRQREPAVQISTEAIAPAALDYRSVRVRGVFDASRSILVDNRVHQGTVGYWVVTPLKITGSARYVLVERGWIAAGVNRKQLPEIATPAQEVEIDGIALPGNPPVFELSRQIVSGKVWQNVTVDRYREHFRIDLQPLLLQQRSESPDGLIRDWSAPTLGSERHRAYAFQWFALACAILILYIVLNVRRKHTLT